MRAGRTLTRVTDMDAQIVDEYVAGAEVPQLAARYNVAPEYVQRLLEERIARGPKRWDWGISPWGNRLLYSVLIALGINLATGSQVGWVLGVAFCVVTSIVAVRRS